ncbi:MAG: hypothetical protein NTX00_02145 [Candidatus Parcubacteria bacterium]|nr:hypothetical protein [Candidatus Parcubacteria bacterium]
MIFKKYKFHLLVLLGLILLNSALFAFNLKDFFLSDDFDWLNIAKNTQHSLIDYFSANYYGERGVGGSYRPMVNLVFWLNYQIGGLNPLPYHLTNLLFHIGVAFVIYLLGLLLFEEFKEKHPPEAGPPQADKIAILAAVIFSILPNHNEAVIWIAAIADPMMAFFYLLAFYLYVFFRKKDNFRALIFSVLFFCLALLSKEMAITLPLLILVWELYEALSKNKFDWRNIILKPLGYWLILILYFIIRYLSIGLIFGYYAQEKFSLHFGLIFKMFISLITDLLFFGKARVLLTNYFMANKLFFIFLLILILTLIWLTLKNYKFKIPFLFDAYFILILPVLLLNFNNLTDEGERYNYLPSIIFCFLLALLVLQLKKELTLQILFSFSIFLYFILILLFKDCTWHSAANLTKKIILFDTPRVLDLKKNGEKIFFAAMPDNLDGAPILRNGLLLAMKSFYPNYNFEGTVLNVYQRLSKRNFDQKILNWGAYPTGGYIAKTIDGGYWVTGYDRRETNDYIFELWNYNYANYTSDTIRLILKNEQGQFTKAGDEKEKIIIFDQGELQTLEK